MKTGVDHDHVLLATTVVNDQGCHKTLADLIKKYVAGATWYVSKQAGHCGSKAFWEQGIVGAGDCGKKGIVGGSDCGSRALWEEGIVRAGDCGMKVPARLSLPGHSRSQQLSLSCSGHLARKAC